MGGCRNIFEEFHIIKNSKDYARDNGFEVTENIADIPTHLWQNL